MTAQLANGGNKINPTIIPNNENVENIMEQMKLNQDFATDYTSLVRNKKNVKFV